MERVADVYFAENLGAERPEVRAEVGDRRRGFTDLARAVRWAELRSERVRVLVDGLSGWDPWPEEPAERERLVAHVRRRIDRYDREYRERRSEPVDWFYAVREPDAEDLAGLAAALAAQPEVDRVAERDRWWVIHVRARTIRAAMKAGGDALLRVTWPPERLEREFGGGGFFISAGGETAFGLAEYEEETLSR